jgi:hypothetical protein
MSKILKISAEMEVHKIGTRARQVSSRLEHEIRAEFPKSPQRIESSLQRDVIAEAASDERAVCGF